MTEGVIRFEIISLTVFDVSSSVSKYANITLFASGFGINLIVAWVIIPNVPSEPTNNCVIL